ncbi:uncharacterized protein DS421_1g13650 [Arachis hypogaea]|nr:uncharacterized protein DS421_1g13650 [Arachis hypogaea]
MSMRLPSQHMEVISGYYRLYNKDIIRSSMGCSSMYLYILMRVWFKMLVKFLDFK